MASMWPPKKNTAFTLCFSLFKTDGTIIADPGTYTKKVSIDGGAVADIAASVTEEDTTYGQLSLVLAAGEMNGDWIWVYIVDDTSGCVPFTCTLYPVANTQDELGASIAAILADTGTDGVVIAADAITAAKIADNAFAAEHFANGAIDLATFAADCKTGNALKANVETVTNGAITAAAIATGALDADALAADAVAEIADGVWDEATSGHSTAGTAGKALTDALADTNELQTDWVNGGRLDLLIDAITAELAKVPKSDSTVSWNATALAAMADKVLGRNIAGGSDTGRTVTTALAGIRNRVVITATSAIAGTMTVYSTDDSTQSWTAALTFDETTGMITEINPT